MTIKELLPQLARSESFRAEFVKSHTKQLLPLQVRDLMEQHDLTQTQLAQRSALSQGTISRAIDPEYGNLTINTCVSIAAGCDVAFVAHFVPFSELLPWLDKHGSDERIPSFTEEFDESGEAKGSPAEVASVDSLTLRTGRAEVVRLRNNRTNVRDENPISASTNETAFLTGVAS